MIKNENRGGFIDRQRKGVGVGEEENYLLFLLELCAGYCALADVFIKNKKKNKTTSVYRLCFARKLSKTTAQECNNSTFGLCASLKKVFC